jgi:hypothetical protein
MAIGFSFLGGGEGFSPKDRAIALLKSSSFSESDILAADNGPDSLRKVAANYGRQPDLYPELTRNR